MTNPSLNKKFDAKNPEYVAQGVTNTISVNTTTDATEQTFTLTGTSTAVSDVYQVQVINYKNYDAVALTGNARIALIAAETADAAAYVVLEPGNTVTFDMIGSDSIYYKRDAAVDVTVGFIERRV